MGSEVTFGFENQKTIEIDWFSSQPVVCDLLLKRISVPPGRRRSWVVRVILLFRTLFLRQVSRQVIYLLFKQLNPFTVFNKLLLHSYLLFTLSFSTALSTFIVLAPSDSSTQLGWGVPDASRKMLRGRWASRWAGTWIVVGASTSWWMYRSALWSVGTRFSFRPLLWAGRRLSMRWSHFFNFFFWRVRFWSWHTPLAKAVGVEWQVRTETLVNERAQSKCWGFNVGTFCLRGSKLPEVYPR